MIIFWCAVFLLFGMLFGSFFNVLIYRLPLKLSVISPPSACPHCKHVIKWYENIPVISYVVQRGRCSSCKRKISIQYPVIEFITGLLSLAIGYHFLNQGYSQLLWWQYIPLLVQYLSLILLIPIILIDIKHRIIPNSITFLGISTAIFVSLIPGGLSPLDMILGIVAGSGMLIILNVIASFILKKQALGFGDIKLLAWFGALFGWKVSVGCIFIGAIIGIIYGTIDHLFRAKSEVRIPFGPSLSLALLINLAAGELLWVQYISYWTNL